MMMTLAPGIPAPEGSDTLPEILPKTACPKSVGGKAAKTTNKKTTDKESGRERALLVRARRPAAAPLHAPAPVARESRSSVFALVAPNANRRAPAKRWIVR